MACGKDTGATDPGSTIVCRLAGLYLITSGGNLSSQAANTNFCPRLSMTYYGVKA